MRACIVKVSAVRQIGKPTTDIRSSRVHSVEPQRVHDPWRQIRSVLIGRQADAEQRAGGTDAERTRDLRRVGGKSCACFGMPLSLTGRHLASLHAASAQHLASGRGVPSVHRAGRVGEGHGGKHATWTYKSENVLTKLSL